MINKLNKDIFRAYKNIRHETSTGDAWFEELKLFCFVERFGATEKK